MNTILFDGEYAVDLANQIAPYGGNFIVNDTIVLVAEKDDDVRAAVIFNRFEEHSVEASIVSSGRYVYPKFIHLVYAQVFNHQNKDVLIMWTSSENERMNNIHEKLGHSKSGTCPNKFGDEDGILWTFTKEQWKRNSKYS